MAKEQKDKKIYRTIEIDSTESLDLLSIHAITKEKMTLKKYLEKIIRDKAFTLKRKATA